MRFLSLFLCLFLCSGLFATTNRQPKISKHHKNNLLQWSWYCHICDKKFYNKKKFYNHLYKRHQDTYFILDELQMLESCPKALPDESMEEKVIGSPLWVQHIDPYARWWCTRHRVTFRDYDRFKEHIKFYHKNC